MKVRATVEMRGCDFDSWKTFFDSYESDRSRFLKNETVLQTGENSAEVTFEMLDIDGLTELSKRKDIIDFEAKNEILVTISGL